MKKLVFKVIVMCPRCPSCIMKTVAKLEGINEIKLDAEKGTLTVIGVVDPVNIVKELRKIGKEVTIDSVNPYKEEKPKPKPCPEPCKPLAPCCGSCRPVAIGYITYDDLNWCTIL